MTPAHSLSLYIDYCLFLNPTNPVIAFDWTQPHGCNLLMFTSPLVKFDMKQQSPDNVVAKLSLLCANSAVN